MSSASSLTMSAAFRIESSTTDASTTSRVRVLPSRAPAAWAAASSNATTSQPRRRRLICACLRGATDLSDHGGRYHRNQARFQPNPVFRPNPALRTVGRDQDACVIDNGLHRGERFRRIVFGSMRARAARSSAGVNAPCSASHSATAASPSRIRRARLGGIRDPRRNALPLGFGCVEHLGVDIGIHGHGKLYGWIPSRHAKPYYRSSMVAICRHAGASAVDCGCDVFGPPRAERSVIPSSQ